MSVEIGGCDYWTCAEVGDELGLSPTSIRSTANRRADIGTKVGRDWLFTSLDVSLIRERQGQRGKRLGNRTGIGG